MLKTYLHKNFRIQKWKIDKMYMELTQYPVKDQRVNNIFAQSFIL